MSPRYFFAVSPLYTPPLRILLRGKLPQHTPSPETSLQYIPHRSLARVHLRSKPRSIPRCTRYFLTVSPSATLGYQILPRGKSLNIPSRSVNFFGASPPPLRILPTNKSPDASSQKEIPPPPRYGFLYPCRIFIILKLKMLPCTDMLNFSNECQIPYTTMEELDVTRKVGGNVHTD
jgi:hypothetical protein